jgi:hypothetical protein
VSALQVLKAPDKLVSSGNFTLVIDEQYSNAFTPTLVAFGQSTLVSAEQDLKAYRPPKDVTFGKFMLTKALHS